jgi:hypothetical protein
MKKSPRPFKPDSNEVTKSLVSDKVSLITRLLFLVGNK